MLSTSGFTRRGKIMRTDVSKSNKGGLTAVVIASLAGVASVQAAGPDVIVGDLPSTAGYGAGTNASGQAIHAYSVGTTSCNVGDTPLNWWANWNEHPVIGQNMYRIDVANSRFLQIGQIWLKHGFTALQGTVCGSCNATAGTTLGVGCSDPYGAGLNGQQSGLGPKSEVNPSTGEYPYPWINNGTGSGAMFKRLQVRDTQLNLANNVYLMSGQYVAHDDAIAGNAFNNESWRRVTVSGFNVTHVDTTQRASAAINAWRAHGLGAGVQDVNVTIQAITVPNDARQLRNVGGSGGPGSPTTTGVWCSGRAYLGNKVVQTSSTSWRYEYALENLNVDRAFQAFQVPVPNDPNLVVLQAGFNDVDYHSGEPYSNTDWTQTVSGGVAAWTGPLYATNANGNALRWGTTYSFWIECNASPTTGTITMPLFKPIPAGAPGGTPTAMTASAAVPGTVVGGTTPPANDNCVNAQTIPTGTAFFNTTNATTDGPDACLFASQMQITKDVWFRWTAPNCNIPVTLSTCGSGFDTKIAVYNNTCPTVAGSQIACNDDSTVCGTGSLQSNLTFNATANTTYLFRVGGYNNAAGTGSLTVTGECAPPPPPPPPGNDLCANAFWIAAGSPVTANTGATGTQSAATNSGGIPSVCGSSSTSPDVWYKYRPLTSGTVTVSTCGSVGSYDTVLSAYSGACGAFTQLACNDDTCGLLSTISFNGTAGQTYYIRVAGFNGATGSYTLNVTGGGGVIPPANDDCANRAGIGLGTTPFSTLGATTDGAADALCLAAGSNQVTNDIWYNHPASCTGTLTIDTCSASTNFDTRVAVYSGNTCTGPIMACDDDGCASLRSTVSIPVTAGNHYRIRVGGFNGATGNGTLTLTCVPTPPPCDPDVNQDGNVDQDDVNYLINVVSGGPNPTGIDPDFNQDGNVDQDDVSALINVIAGGDCP
jgi:hypothetical protein